MPKNDLLESKQKYKSIRMGINQFQDTPGSPHVEINNLDDEETDTIRKSGFQGDFTPKLANITGKLFFAIHFSVLQ